MKHGFLLTITEEDGQYVDHQWRRIEISDVPIASALVPHFRNVAGLPPSDLVIKTGIKTGKWRECHFRGALPVATHLAWQWDGTRECAPPLGFTLTHDRNRTFLTIERSCVAVQCIFPSDWVIVPSVSSFEDRIKNIIFKSNAQFKKEFELFGVATWARCRRRGERDSTHLAWQWNGNANTQPPPGLVLTIDARGAASLRDPSTREFINHIVAGNWVVVPQGVALTGCIKDVMLVTGDDFKKWWELYDPIDECVKKTTWLECRRRGTENADVTHVAWQWDGIFESQPPAPFKLCRPFTVFGGLRGLPHITHGREFIRCILPQEWLVLPYDWENYDRVAELAGVMSTHIFETLYEH